MAHKYIKEIINLNKTPYGWSKNTGRDSQWLEERRVYGFDARETWALDTTFFYWLYERLMMFNKVNCINTSFHKFNINGEKLTQQECIDRMIFGCKYYITKGSENEAMAFRVAEEILTIWKECIFSMWW
ncbi:hypothetical protein AGE29_01220 (plasmid) [Clostridium botulinum]|uniref:Uncharacterized protein n=1 Tax=Clostridium botulinum (strain 657 / Type Ba4) TaxID=515621 RepID=A0A3F2ZZI0_CLOB6|nr:hypothetical protein [Clostridium botulinum]ACQ51178.1 hypothetical protein CLJ_0158 [Clostridium botulinum Ba4 str. 657]AXG90460.1 hypothetical protein AGE29_01220 [Clostridium botulinum]MCR1166745.1 hypothetical protein [Clostridium botulinum]NFM32922.1 hypothetical protein [Clostridium botulinum]RFM20389.1 hypothetical protein C1146_18460 [Clostridium botulinum]